MVDIAILMGFINQFITFGGPTLYLYFYTLLLPLNNKIPKGWVRLPLLMGKHPESLIDHPFNGDDIPIDWRIMAGQFNSQSAKHQIAISSTDILGFHIIHIWLFTPIFLVNSIILVISNMSHIQTTSLWGATHCQGRDALVLDHLGSIPSSSIKSP